MRSAIEALAQAWHDVAHEGFLDVGLLRVASLRFVRQQQRNCFDLGRDYGSAFGPCATYPPRRHLRSV